MSASVRAAVPASAEAAPGPPDLATLRAKAGGPRAIGKAICTLHDVGRESAVDFLVMEHLEGETLAARLAASAGAHVVVQDWIEE